MKEIEDATIVGGHVDAFGNLILETRDGQYLLGGHVAGQPGDPGAPGSPGVVDQETLDDINDRIDDNKTDIINMGVEAKTPTNLVVLTNAAGFQPDGSVLTKVYLMWDVVVSSKEDKPISIAEYQIWTRTDTEVATPYRSTPESEIILEGWTPGVRQNITVRARAVGSTRWSDLSEEISVVPVFPSFVDIPPSIPILESSLGKVYPFWDGLLEEPAEHPAGFRHLLTEISKETDVWEEVGIPSVRKGQTGIVRSDVGEELSVRFRWQDTLGRTSSPSEIATITVSGIARLDLNAEVRDALAQAEADAAAALASVLDSVSSVVIEYAVGSSETVAPTTGWSANQPARNPGQFVWTRTVIKYVDDTTETSAPAVMSGGTGVGLQSAVTGYQVGNSGTVAPTGTWVSNPQVPGSNQFLWTRTLITWTDGSTSTAYSVSSQGSSGAPGRGIFSVTPYFQLVGSTSGAPAKPTTNPPPAGWTLTEPGYNSSTELYRTELIVYTDTNFAYTNVTKVSSYTAATEAVTVANLADAKAAGLIRASETDPGHSPGRIWLVLNGAGQIIGMKTSNGSVWSSYLIMADQILVPSSVGTVSIKNGSVTANKLIIGDFVNYLAGSDFESDLTNPWGMNTSGFSIATDQSHSGARSLKLSGITSSTSTMYLSGSPFIEGQAGDRFYVEFWARRDAAWNGTSSNSKLRFANRLGGGFVAAVPYSVTTITEIDTWVKLSAEVVLPAGSNGMTTSLVNDATAGNLWIDDISVRKMNGGEILLDGTLKAAKLNANEIWADEGWLNVLRAGVIETTMVTPDFGDTLNLMANGAINAIIETQVDLTEGISNAQDTATDAATAVGAVADDTSKAQATATNAQNKANAVDNAQKTTDGKVETLRTWFRVDSEGAHIGKSNSSFQTHMKNDRFEITENNIVTTYWESGQMVVPSAVVTTVELSNHKIEPYGTGTIIRAIGV
jgi:hypothetical protein